MIVRASGRPAYARVASRTVGDFRAARLDDNVKKYRKRSYFVWLKRSILTQDRHRIDARGMRGWYPTRKGGQPKQH